MCKDCVVAPDQTHTAKNDCASGTCRVGTRVEGQHRACVHGHLGRCLIRQPVSTYPLTSSRNQQLISKDTQSQQHVGQKCQHGRTQPDTAYSLALPTGALASGTVTIPLVRDPVHHGCRSSVQLALCTPICTPVTCTRRWLHCLGLKKTERSQRPCNAYNGLLRHYQQAATTMPTDTTHGKGPCLSHRLTSAPGSRSRCAC